jgi:hypothetical protein
MGTGREILCGLIYKKCISETESRKVAIKGWGWGDQGRIEKGNLLVKGYTVSVRMV